MHIFTAMSRLFSLCFFVSVLQTFQPHIIMRFFLCLFSCTSFQTVFFFVGGGEVVMLCSIVACFSCYYCWGLFYDHCFVLQLLICLLHPVRLVFVIGFIGHIVL